MLAQQYQKLIDTIIEKTQEKKIKWQRTSQSCRFEMTLGDQTISIYSAADEQPTFWSVDFGDPKAEFLILDKDGSTTDSIRSYKKDDTYRDLQPLYQAAKASATNLRERLDSLQNSLDNL